MQARGFGDELWAVCFGDSGMWGAIVMYRERGAPNFAARDVDLLASLSGEFAEAQRVRLERDLSADAEHRGAGVLLLDDEDGMEMADDAATAWLDDLHDHGRRRRLPLVVTAVADRARAIASGHSDTERRHESGRRPVDGSSCADQCSATEPIPAPRSR
jgi:hypothetical protein